MRGATAIVILALIGIVSSGCSVIEFERAPGSLQNHRPDNKKALKKPLASHDKPVVIELRRDSSTEMDSTPKVKAWAVAPSEGAPQAGLYVKPPKTKTEEAPQGLRGLIYKGIKTGIHLYNWGNMAGKK